jgi:hypothetical protein
MPAIIKFIKEKLRRHSDGPESGGASESGELLGGRSPFRGPNAYSPRRQVSPSDSQTVSEDAWELWNTEEGRRFGEREHEGVPKCGDRINNIADLQALAKVARDIPGMPGSSTSRERLFSQAGLIVNKKRGDW